ncbi:pyridoxal kinase [Methylocella tundrae]|uniref:pyridoxal kinase n=1 Tax=Methylocella tundrae TaxID=227605 RepID=A0A4U8YY79_METTU|nr:pyridoxal kinase [Methylocella tundrae]WPP05352.1 pyridoxal kinase [Methylocella tundrae]VFU07722.1 Pyridoxal kinase PdxY [Methylocella tundrae]
MESSEARREPPGSIGLGPHVIAIQSQVVHGHVGNSAAVFPMQTLGLTVAAVPTTLLSNHPLYPTMRGRVLDAALVDDLLRGVEERGLVEASKAMLTGYLGSARVGAVVAEFVGRAKARNPDLLYVCDPVIGDDGPGVFVAEEIIEIIRDRLAPAASIITPNQFELELLTQAPARSIMDLHVAAAGFSQRGPMRLVVTGCTLIDTPAGHIETIVYDHGALHRIATQRLPIKPNGAGDLFAGLFVAHLANGADLLRAAEAATAGVFKVLQRTLAERSYELRISPSDFLHGCRAP